MCIRDSLPLVIRHSDAAREYAYDSRAGRLLAEAAAQDWPVVDMARDWGMVFRGERDDDRPLTADR